MPLIHPDRVSASYADARIHEKIEQFDEPRQQAGLRGLDADLKAVKVPDFARLHLMLAIADLGMVSAQSLEARMTRAATGPPL